jgi:hypothetical protein
VIAGAAVLYLNWNPAPAPANQLPKGAELALLEAPALRAGLLAFRRGEQRDFDNAHRLLNRLALDEAALADPPCSRSAMTADAAKDGVEILSGLGSARPEETEMVRFVVLRQVLGDWNRQSRAPCGVERYRQLERILPNAQRRSQDQANTFYLEWRAALQQQLGGAYYSTRDNAARQAGMAVDDRGSDL